MSGAVLLDMADRREGKVEAHNLSALRFSRFQMAVE